MGISAISSSAPIQPPETSTAPDPSNDNDADDAGAVQPVAAAPLPPGQGTRIDQLV
jgi:hypothetical protein